jgi:hypothetical protein
MLINRDNIGRQQKRPHRMPTNPKPELEMRQLPAYRVHYKALEAYVRKVFGFEFDFFFATGSHEGCTHDYIASGSIPTVALDKQSTDLRDGKRTKNVLLILNVLVHDGYIPAGAYTITTTKPEDPTAVYTYLLRRTQTPLHPDCVSFKNEHQGDAVFMQRAAVLEQSLLDQLK